jgi:hypothetical protein
MKHCRHNVCRDIFVCTSHDVDVERCARLCDPLLVYDDDVINDNGINCVDAVTPLQVCNILSSCSDKELRSNTCSGSNIRRG